MLSDIFVSIREKWLSEVPIAYSTSNIVNFVLIMGGLLLIWRIWKFTILPSLYPDRPEVLPYWIPFLGHAISFFSDSDSLFSYGREYFRNTRAPFAIKAAGETLYIITSVSDVSEVYKNMENLTFDDYIYDMMVSFGATSQAIQKMWGPPSPNLKRVGYDISGGGVLAHMSQSLARQQLQPGERLENLQNVLLSSVHESMSWENMTPKTIISSSSQNNTRTISLLEWTRQVLMEGATTSFFGPSLLELEPQLFESFFSFDDKSWKLTYNIPAPWSNDMKSAKATAQTALTKYFEMPRERRPGACWLVETLEMEMKAVGIQPADMAAYLMMYYWVINANTWKVSFWMLAYIVHDPHLLMAIRKEISPLINSNSTISPNELVASFNSTATPQLLALYHEVIRIVTSSVSVRNVVGSVVVGGKQLRPGGRVIIPYRQLLLNDDVFGRDATEFNHERFLHHDGILSNNPSYRPFGGGSTYCPGRFLAKAEILTCVALAIGRFDMELVSGNENKKCANFPRLELQRPCLGIMSPKEGNDVVVNISKRI